MRGSRSWLESLLFLIRFVARDIRGGVGRFISFGALLGVSLAVLVASQGSVSSIRHAVRSSAREVIGADVIVSSRTPIPPILGSVYGPRSAFEYRIRSMARSSTAAQLAQVRAIDDQYPFFGAVRTNPPDVPWRERGEAVLEKSLMDRLGLKVGDMVDVLGISVRVSAELVSAPGGLSAAYVVSPRLYIPRRLIADSILSARGSMVDYAMFVATDDDAEGDRVADQLRERLDVSLFDVATASSRAERMSSVISSIGALASTVSLATMALSLLAIAFAIRFHLRGKRPAAAVLRAIGASKALISCCFFSEKVLLGVFAAVVGSVGGWGLSRLIVSAAETQLGIGAVPHGGLGSLVPSILFMFVCLAWAAAPSIHHLSITPALSVLRSDVEPPARRRVDSIVRALIGILLIVSAWLLLGAEKSAAILLSGAALSLAVSIAVSYCARWAARRVSSAVETFYLRVALRNLDRPGNQTIPVLSSMVLALALSCAVSVVQSTLESARSFSAEQGRANVFLYELAPEQSAEAETILSQSSGQALQRLPVVMMRIARVKGVSVSEILGRKGADDPPRWALTREYWTSYRGELLSNERVVAGDWFTGAVNPQLPIPISLEDSLAEKLGVSVGDTIEWDVQGVLFTTRVASLRDILWEKFERNSFVVFPPRVLEGAPQFLFWSMSIPEASDRASFIKEVSVRLPNVSTIDLTSVVEEVLKIIGTIGVGLKLLLMVILVTAAGLILITAVGARVERAPEFATLTRIGMRRVTKRAVVRMEFLVLGILAVVCGIGLGTVIGWAIAHFGFNAAVVIDWKTLAALAGATLVLCGVCGRIVCSQRPISA